MIIQGTGNYSFDKVLLCNIGDCHAMGQKPLTFVRQLLAACAHPEELDGGCYPEDVKERARLILEHCGGQSIGWLGGGGVEVSLLGGKSISCGFWRVVCRETRATVVVAGEV